MKIFYKAGGEASGGAEQRDKQGAGEEGGQEAGEADEGELDGRWSENLE